MPRAFIALDLPEAAQERLSDVCQNLPGADWAYSDQLHLTLRFLGEPDPETFAVIREALHGLSARSFPLTLRGMGFFPLRGEPEILWAGVSKNEGLLSLRHKVESVLARNGMPPDTRKFFPHVTLAKVGGSREAWVGRYIADHALFSIPDIPIQSYALFSSRLKPEGAEYTLEEVYPLVGILDAE
jgi:RNA 2',3'-cyclic 3'-phosphodiesterase